tara:strand:- start:219 stop:554 length:336 start_codon:yes stop_codon:yes gene_type:complete
MKSYKDLKEELTNTAGPMSDPNFAGLGLEPAMKPRKQKKRDKFAGCKVFDVTSEEYQKCLKGRMKYERWGKKLNMEDNDNQEIRSYSHKTREPVIVRNMDTGEMTYLIHRR